MLTAPWLSFQCYAPYQPILSFNAFLEALVHQPPPNAPLNNCINNINLLDLLPTLNQTVAHTRQWTVLDHKRHDLVKRIRSRHGSQLSIGVISRSNLDNIRSNKVNTLKTTNDSPEFPSRPTTSLRGTGRRRKRRVKGIDVDREVDRVLVSDALVDFLDDTGGADLVDLTGLDNLEAAVAVVLVVGEAGQGSADSGVDVGVVAHQTLLCGVVEVGSVVDAGLLGGCAAEDLWSPGVEVGVEVDYGDWAVGFVHAAEERECDGVVTAEGDDTGEGLALGRRARSQGVGGWLAHEDAVVAFFDLLDGEGVVVAGYVRWEGGVVKR